MGLRGEVAVLASACAAMGCVHQRSASALADLVGETVTVEYAQGPSEEALVITTPGGPALRTRHGVVASAQVARVRSSDHLRGALEGLGIGTLASLGLAGSGVGAALIYGDAPPSPSCDHSYCISDSGAALLLGVVAVVLGAGGGALVGLVKGSDDVYDPRGLAKVNLSGPPGTVMGATVRF